MSADFGQDPTLRVATRIGGMHPSERRVAELLGAEPECVVELTAQELADRVGVARSTVVRACQSLGYRGFPQLRVALAGELARRVIVEPDYGSGVLGRIRAEISELAASLPRIIAMLTEEDTAGAVADIVAARRVLVVASGLSGPLAIDLSMRLTSAGRPAETLADPLGQQISAGGLGAEDVCIVISGSGASAASIRAARAARESGASVIAVTSFRAAPLNREAQRTLIIAPAGGFRQELEHTSRVPHTVFLEALAEAVRRRLGATGESTRSRVLGVLSENLVE